MFQPRSRRRCESGVEPAVAQQPPLDVGGLVGGVVVEDEMHLEVLGNSSSMRTRNFLNSTARCGRCSEPMTLPWPCRGQRTAMSCRGGCSRGCVVRECRASWAGWAGSGPGPGSGLLVHAQHHGPLGGIEIEPTMSLTLSTNSGRWCRVPPRNRCLSPAKDRSYGRAKSDSVALRANRSFPGRDRSSFRGSRWLDRG